jgi:glucose-1-phosphate thymidylyltransferase
LKESVPKLAREFQDSPADALVVVSRVKDPSRFGVVQIEGDKIVKLVEKPKKFVSDWALTGVYFLRPSIFPVIESLKPSWRNELEITEAIQALLERGGIVRHHDVSGWWKDTGRPEDILEANRLVLGDLRTSIKGRIEEGAMISGSVEVARGTVVHGGASIRGPSSIGEESEIGDGAYIGPFTSVGNRVKIIGAEVENSIVLDGVTIDCNERIVDSIIGKNSKIVSNQNHKPSGRRFVVGESTFVSL